MRHNDIKFVIRPAGLDDADVIGHIHFLAKSHKNHHAHTETEKLYKDNWIRYLRDSVNVLLALNLENVPLGFIAFGPLKTPPAKQGRVQKYTSEIYGIYVHPDAWRQSVGRLLMDHAARHLTAQGHSTAVLWVNQSNKQAMAFYKSLGGVGCGRHNAILDGKPAIERAIAWDDLNALIEKEI